MAGLKAQLLLKANIDALLTARGLKRKDLAKFCRRSEGWLSQLFRPERNIPLKYLDRIADYFGLAPYQLFSPGISPLTERRSGRDRRAGGDRRRMHVAEMRAPVLPQAELIGWVRTLSEEEYRQFAIRARAALALTAPRPDDTTQPDRAPATARSPAAAPRTQQRRRGTP